MTTENLIKSYFDSTPVPQESINRLVGTRDEDKFMTAVMRRLLGRFSKDSKYKVTESGESYTGPFTLTSWYPGSEILYVEYPSGLDDPSILNNEEFDISESGELTIYAGSSASGYKVRYSAKHVIPSDKKETTTLTEDNTEAFFLLVDYEMYVRLATQHAESTRSEISVDSDNGENKSRNYRELAKLTYERYRNLLGLPKEEVGRTFIIEEEIVNTQRIFPA